VLVGPAKSGDYRYQTLLPLRISGEIVTISVVFCEDIGVFPLVLGFFYQISHLKPGKY